MTQPLNIGVLGCSSFAQRSMIPAMQSMPEKYKLLAVASRLAANSMACAKSLGIPQSFGSYAELLDVKEINAIYMPLPNSLHAEWIEKALDKGLHVLVEKSLACNSKDVTRLCSKANELGLALLENFQFRFHRQLGEIKEVLNKGQIGELRSIHSSFGFPPFADKNNIRYQRKLGGGALLDAGTYPIKIAQLFMGDDINITSASLFTDEKKGVDIWGGGFIQKNNSPLFTQIAFGFDNYYQCSLELWGSRGKLIANRIFTSPPDFSPEIIVEGVSGTQVIKVKADNHFVNVLNHFYEVTQNTELIKEELENNIQQSVLIEQFRKLACL